MSIEKFREDLNEVGTVHVVNDKGDFVVEELKLIFEFCVFKEQCDHISGQHRSFHVKKQKEYMDAGYIFYVIFEDEYKNKRDIVMSRIKNLLHRNVGEKVYARNCEVREITTSESSPFIQKFHIQGNAGSRVKLGMFKNNGIGFVDLISVMTFSKLSRAKGNKNITDTDWELSRFCSDSRYRCIGAAGKLMKYFERNYPWTSILTFADRRWSPTGGVYPKIGFGDRTETQANYYYLKVPEYDNRIHRFAFRRNVLRDRAMVETTLTEEEIMSKTEFQLAIILGYDRIFDCGNYKFMRYNNQEI